MAVISINIVLSRMQQTVDERGNPVVFKLEFIKEDGSLRKMTAQKHVKFPSNKPGNNEKSNFKYSLNKNGAVLLYDTEERDYRAVKIDRIIKFNNMEVLH
jgi:hypothetical protein